MHSPIQPQSPPDAVAQECFNAFRADVTSAIADGSLAQDVIGKGMVFDGTCGPVKLVYADYAASGRALGAVERFVTEKVLPVYANPHTQASYCGRSINALRRAARGQIAACCEANEDDAVIFAGSGATAGIHKLVRLFGADCLDPDGQRPLVILGPYEHHSNLLPWRESGAEVVELPEGPDGGPDPNTLERVLAEGAGRRIIAAFSAGSNVTGALSDIPALSRLVAAQGGKVIWDYAGAAPYLPMSMHPEPGVHVDAIVCSPHKFIGGPAASGVLVVRRASVILDRPSLAGGGTVSFVSPDGQDYLSDVIAREEAGTPNAVGDIRAALAMIVTACLNAAGLNRRAVGLRQRALAQWRSNPAIEILGTERDTMLPILSFRVRNRRGELVHHQLVTRILSDRFGVQARGGCACAGPYVHNLLGLDQRESQAIRHAIRACREIEKPGFVRVNFSPLMDEDEFAQLVQAVDLLARESDRFAAAFRVDPSTAVFSPAAEGLAD